MNGTGWKLLGLSFMVVILLLTTAYFVVHTYALHSGEPVSVSLGLPAFSLSFPQPAQGGATWPMRAPEARQFSVVMTMIGEGENEVHRWLPATLVVQRGDTVILRVTNADPDAAHGFALAGYDLFEKVIEPGKTVTFQFEAKTSGVFLFSCALPGCAKDHADQTGQLIVLP